MIPKSLHTVPALVAVARGYLTLGRQASHPWTPADAVREAAHVLGYPAGTPDPHGLLDVATRKLAREVRT